jgi:hypothetical protein
MATQREATQHEVTILYNETTGQLQCDPDLLKPDEKVRKKDTIRWKCESLDTWAVVFGPDSPFEQRLMGQGLSILGPTGATGASDMTTVIANRPHDFHKHKYVAIAWTGDKLVACDPEVDVEE